MTSQHFIAPILTHSTHFSFNKQFSCVEITFFFWKFRYDKSHEKVAKQFKENGEWWVPKATLTESGQKRSLCYLLDREVKNVNTWVMTVQTEESSFPCWWASKEWERWGEWQIMVSERMEDLTSNTPKSKDLE